MASYSLLLNQWEHGVSQLHLSSLIQDLSCAITYILYHFHSHFIHLSFPVTILLQDLRADLQLDWLKGTRGGVKRVLFLDTQQPQHTGLLRLGHNQQHACLSYMIYLRVRKWHRTRAYNEESTTLSCLIAFYFMLFHFFLSRRRMSSGTS